MSNLRREALSRGSPGKMNGPEEEDRTGKRGQIKISMPKLNHKRVQLAAEIKKGLVPGICRQSRSFLAG